MKRPQKVCWSMTRLVIFFAALLSSRSIYRVGPVQMACRASSQRRFCFTYLTETVGNVRLGMARGVFAEDRRKEADLTSLRYLVAKWRMA